MTKLSKEKAVYFHKFSIYFRMFGMRRKQIQIATIETNISLQNPLKNGKIHDVTYGDITSPPFVNRVQSTFCQSSPVHLLSIESSPPFVNRVQSTFCQSSPPFVNRVQSTFCQSSPVHLLSIESSPPFVNRVQSTFCQSSPVHLLSVQSSPRFVVCPQLGRTKTRTCRMLQSDWRHEDCSTTEKYVKQVRTSSVH